MRNKQIAGIFYLISTFFIGMGLYKMFAYENTDSYFKKSVNVYVGGDAYNYIINSNYATGFFVLALLFTIVGCTFLLLDKADELKKDRVNTNNNEKFKEIGKELVCEDETITEIN